MTVLVTGAAGFIGFHTCLALLKRGERVIGIDNLNNYYDVSLKQARLSCVSNYKAFTFARADVSNLEALKEITIKYGPFYRIIHLAAQAGVRHSLENPMAYVHSNLVGHAGILEICHGIDNFQHLVYASSSSVYGGNANTPCSVKDRVDRPISLYAATKAADELMSHTYSHLYNLPQTGLRFFTVYGPWGRPDMALYLFTEAILNDRPIRVFNYGDMRRDFTYVDDIVDGILRALDRAPDRTDGSPPHRVYNLGNNQSEPLLKVIGILETVLGKQAEKKLEPIQPGDVRETFADISESVRDLGFNPSTNVEEGVSRFVAWYRTYNGL